MVEADPDDADRPPVPRSGDSADAPARDRPPDATPRRNWDAYAALVATLIGLLALLVSGYTAYVQRQQLRAQVWPYLTVATENAPPAFGIHVINSGTGPARVTAVRVTVDRQPVRSWAHAQKVMGVEPGGIIQSQLSSSVLPAGRDLMFLRPYNEQAGPRFEELFLGDKHAIAITVCFCSVLDECWVASSSTVPEAISGADACPIAAAEKFKE